MPEKERKFHEFMPEEVWKWKQMEDQFNQVLSLFNYNEIRLSILQDHDVLHKGITALMQGREAEQAAARTINVCEPDGNLSLLSLRPEGTISVLHHTAANVQPGVISRYYYHGPMFRKNRAGKPLEFYQLGVELLGSDSLLSENEVISLGMRLLKEFGLRDATLKLNSYGCENCRSKFFADVRANLEAHADEYCRACYEDLSANPFSDGACRDEKCRHTLQQGPVIDSYLCPTCKDNFQRIKKIQANLGHLYKVDPHLFKNFAYYNETVFDFVLQEGGKEVTLGGGGRYDYLSARITGRRIPAVGFYLDLDRVFQVMAARKLFHRRQSNYSVYICAQSPNMEMMMLQIAQELHGQKIRTVLSPDNLATEVESANAKANKCELMIVIREENIREGKLLLHNFSRETQAYIPLDHLAESVEIARKSSNKL